MGRRVNSRVERRQLRLIGPSVLALATAVLVTALALVWTTGRLNSIICGGDCGSEYAVVPDGVMVAQPSLAGPDQAVASPPDLGPFLAAATRQIADSPVLGDHVGVALASTDPGGRIESKGDGAYIPASTTKILTSFAALATLEPQHRFVTRTVLAGDRLTLVGGGDPYLTDRRQRDDPKVVRADLQTLADRTAKQLKGALRQTSVTLDFDTSMFAGPGINPNWPATYVRDNVVTTISPLWIDRGMRDTSQPETTARAARPAEEARDAFAAMLRQRGITVTAGSDRPASAGATPVADVAGSTVAQIVESTVRTSDDEAAELLLRHIAIATGEEPSFAGGSRAVSKVLEARGISTESLILKDGSGLSRVNRISPATLVEVVRASLTDGRFAPVIDDLPVSGFSGTLAARFARSGQGWIRAKTGTLTGVHSLAGIVLDRQARPIVFALMSDKTDRSQPFAAQAALDKVAAALAEAR